MDWGESKYISIIGMAPRGMTIADKSTWAALRVFLPLEQPVLDDAVRWEVERGLG